MSRASLAPIPLTPANVESWRKTFSTLASHAEAGGYHKRFMASPDGRFVVMDRDRIVYDGTDEGVALMRYNSF